MAAFDTANRPGVIRMLRRTAVRQPSLPRRAAADEGPVAVVPVDPQERQPRGHRPVRASVHAAIRRRAALAGYDENIVAQLGGHSLRAGFVTQAFRNGADAHAIMRQTGHIRRPWRFTRGRTPR